MSGLLTFLVLLIAAGGFVIHYFGAKSSRGPVFEVREANGWATLIATPAPLPFRITVVSAALAIFPAWIVGGMIYARNPETSATPIVGFLTWILAGVLIRQMWQSYHDHHRKVVREPLQISDQGIRLGSQIIPADQVLSVVRGNAQDGRTVVIGGSSMAAGVGHMAVQTLSLLTGVSHTVEVEHVGRRTVLAGGLTEAQANSVAAEVIRRLPNFSR
jgi:hypothetical protein